MESVRSAWLHVLNRFATQADASSQIGRSDGDIDTIATLVEEGYIKGEVIRDGDSLVYVVTVERLTHKGRQLADRLAQELEEQKPATKAWRWAGYVLAGIGGIIATLIGQALAKWLGIS